MELLHLSWRHLFNSCPVMLLQCQLVICQVGKHRRLGVLFFLCSPYCTLSVFRHHVENWTSPHDPFIIPMWGPMTSSYPHLGL